MPRQKALAEGYFVWQPAGAHALPGLSEPVPVYQALRVSGAQHRLDSAHPQALTPLVGRAYELGLLLERWGQVQAGEGQVVVLSGEAGIGKSRLVLTLKARVADRAFYLEYRGASYHQYTAFHPLIEALHRLLHGQDERPAASHQQRLEAFVARYPPLMLSPQQQRQKLLAMLLTFVVEQARDHAVVLIEA